MTAALWLFFLQGTMGAFDTLYYHEWRARLPARGPKAGAELELHSLRDFIYAILFATLPWIAWQGLFVLALGALLAAEIGITLTDFVVEDRVRAPLGGVYAGERLTHAIMGILYGAALACLAPAMVRWWSAPSALALSPPAVPEGLRWVMAAMAGGVFLSGLRDVAAARGLRGSSWPWQ